MIPASGGRLGSGAAGVDAQAAVGSTGGWAVIFDIDDTLVDFSAAAAAALIDAVGRHLDTTDGWDRHAAARPVGPAAGSVVAAGEPRDAAGERRDAAAERRDAAAEPRDAAAASHAAAGSPLDTATVQRAWLAVNETQYRRYTSGELSFQAMRVARMVAFLDELGAPSGTGLAADIENDRHSVIFDHYLPFPDVAPTLRALRECGAVVGVLSNSDGDYQRRKLATVGLSGVFAAEIFSGDLGIAKPDPRIFHAATSMLGIAAGRAVYVGDRWVDDILGARRAGLSAVWLDRRGEGGAAVRAARTEGRMAPGESDWRDDLLINRITGLAELPAALAGLGFGIGDSANGFGLGARTSAL